jgi:magnesium chelatase family protein
VHRVSLERQGCLNSAISAEHLDEVAPLSRDAMVWLRRKLDDGHLSGRGYHRIRRVARTLADMHGEHEVIKSEWVETAVSMRVSVVTQTEFH